MKLKIKIAAVITAAFMSLSAVAAPAYAESATPAETTAAAENQAPEESNQPSLGQGAFHSSHDVARSSYPGEVRKGDLFNLSVTAYIPINNFYDGVKKEDFDTSKVFTLASSNESFSIGYTYGDQLDYGIKGEFFCITSYYYGVEYTGVGNVFDYTLCYSSEDNSISVPMSVKVYECIIEEEKTEEIKAPSYTLAPGQTYTVKAGTSKHINLNLSSIGEGEISLITAMLTSSDGNVVVEDIGEKTSAFLNPSFNFKISAPETANEGIYNLTLSGTIFNKKGAEAGSYSYNIPVKVTSDVKSSALTVKSYETSKKTIRSGDKFDLAITFENNCGIDLENFEVSLTGLDSTKFVLDGGFSKQTAKIKNGKTAKVTFPLVACDGIAFVRESIGVQAVYSINQDNTNNLETSVILNCEPKNKEDENKPQHEKYDLTMTSYQVSSTAVAENTRFTLSLTLENSSKNKIENARLSLMGLDGMKFAIDSGLTYKDFSIGAGKTKNFTFEIIGCKGISSIREVIPILIEYDTVSSEVNATISCVPKATPEEEAAGQVFAPNIIIESYSYGGDFVTAGQTFPFKVIIKNTSDEAVIENLKVTVRGGSTIDGGIAFSPANSANSFFFERLGLKDTTEISLDLLAKADVVPNSYPVEISFTYEYAAGGKSYQANPVTETLTIPLQQEDRLTINEPSYPNWTVMVGEMCYISTSLVNKGKSGVYNVTATVEGEGFEISSGASYYIGNINSGSEEYYDAQIIPNTEGEIKGEIVVTYEDANGTEKEQRLPFTFSAMNMTFDDSYMDPGYMDPGMMEEMPPEEKGFNWLPVVIGAAVVIAVVVIIIVAVKKRKKRRMELEDDDEDI